MKIIPTEYDRYLFHQGSHYRCYEFLGAHPTIEDGTHGVRFNLWAPNAIEVYVIGEFNNWQQGANPLNKIKESGIWTSFIPGVEIGSFYKYVICGPENNIRIKADPFAYHSEIRPGTASRVYRLGQYNWQDKNWIKNRKVFNPLQQPLSIYEIHLGSWKKKENGDFLNYCEIADQLVEYISKLGFTHVELLPITEHPYDGSWGYQSTGYYAPTSRYGSPSDLMYFIDKCHQYNIGVIMDWVPGHFCRDDHGLRLFDGTPLFESNEPKRARNLQWDTLNFDFNQPEVWSFLISNAYFWFKHYHIDGLRVDAVSNILYLDYQKEKGEWIPNQYGGNENIEGINFIKKLNEVIFDNFPGSLMIAEESSTWPKITTPTYHQGLGFNYKWNLGWMNDTLSYMETDPIYRKQEHNSITFSLMYTYSENYILPLSHDEVVHGKKSLLDKMPGDYDEKFASLRLLYGFMTGHPGKQLLFMGGEFGQFIEWNCQQELDWHLFNYQKHRKLFKYVKDLNQLYLKEKPFWIADHLTGGFQWIDPDDWENNVLSFIRFNPKNNDHIIIICNFSAFSKTNYQIGVPLNKPYKIILNSNWHQYGGTDKQKYNILAPNKLNKKEIHGFSYSINLELPPLTVLYLKSIKSYS